MMIGFVNVQWDGKGRDAQLKLVIIILFVVKMAIFIYK